MIVNVRLDLDDDTLRHIATLLSGRQVKRTATRAEICALGAAFFNPVRNVDPCQVRQAHVESVADAVVSDIDRGGWTLIGEPPGIE